MTRLCSPWDYSQQDEYPADGFAEFLNTSTIDSKEMDDMLVHCNKNSVYVLDSSYRYRDFDMIELFGSPAGRALTVNNRTAAEMQSCSKLNNSTNSSSNIASTVSNGAASLQNHALSQQPLYHPLSNCAFSGTCSTIGASFNHHTSHPTATNNFAESSDLIRFRSNHPQLNQHHRQTTNYSNNNGRTNSKIAKIWKLFDEDRIRKGANTGSHNSINNHSNSSNSSSSNGTSGSDIFNRCQSRRKSSPIRTEEKTTKDLYNEAAQLLGINCTLSDSCRCIDCQSQYFDCDDFDSYSEYSDKSYDTEENFVVNQSYFYSSTNGHNQRDDLTDGCRHDERAFGSTESPNTSDDFSSYSATPNDKNYPKDGNTNQQLHLEGTNVRRDGDENDDDNGNNKSNQYLLNDTSHNLHPKGEARRRRSNENEIGLAQQILSSGDGSSSSIRDYANAGEFNEPETDSNLIA